MARLKADKIEQGKVIAQWFNDSTAAVVTEYRGISAEDLASLRRDLRNVGGEFHVLKNRVAIKAIELNAESATELKPLLKGPVGIAYMKEDVAAGAKTLLKHVKENDFLKVTGGVMDGKALDENELKALSELPSKEVLLGKIVGSIVTPHRNLLSVLQGVSRQLVGVIGAIKDQKSE